MIRQISYNMVTGMNTHGHEKASHAPFIRAISACVSEQWFSLRAADLVLWLPRNQPCFQVTVQKVDTQHRRAFEHCTDTLYKFVVK